MKMRDSKETKQPFWKRRYVVVIHGFIVYFLLSTYRIGMSVTIVAMVDSEYGNHTVLHLSNGSTSREISNGLTHDQYPIRYNWSPKIQGGILGAGFFGYLLCLIIGGKLAESFGPRIMLIIGTFISSFSTLVTPFTASISPYFVIFIQCWRGIGQALMFPAMSVLSANWFPSSERGLLSGIAFSGYSFSFLVSGILSSLICDSISIGGWPIVFYAFGGFGIFVSISQYFSLTSLPKDDSRISKAELKYILESQENKLTLKRPAVPWGKILRAKSTYALLFGTFGQYWMDLHYILMHATFLGTILHFPMAQIGILVATPFILSMFITLMASFISSFLRARNYFSTSKIRISCNLIGSVIYSICLIVMISTKAENTVTIVTTVIGIGITAFTACGVLIVALDMTPNFAGSLSALNTTIASLAGFLLPIVCGIITNEEQTIEQWNKFFIISIVIVLSSAIFFCFFGSAEIQSYNFIDEDFSSKTEEETKNNSKAVELSVISRHT